MTATNDFSKWGNGFVSDGADNGLTINAFQFWGSGFVFDEVFAASSNIKSRDGLAYSGIKTVDGLPIGSVKTIMGLQ